MVGWWGGGGGVGVRGQLRARSSNKPIPHILIVLLLLFFFFSFFVALKCADDEFPCVTVCISKDWVCDNQDDCGDNADEIDCDVITSTYVACQVHT